jgi:hypothetical protein
MSQEQTDITGANGGGFFDVDWLTNLVVPFEFEFEGHKLKGRWYKYKTTTPMWARGLRERQTQRLERYTEIENELRPAIESKDRRAQARLIAEKTKLDEEYQRASYLWLADAIVEWNAVDAAKTPIPIDVLRFDGFPLPFMVSLGQYLEDSRTDKNPT